MVTTRREKGTRTAGAAWNVQFQLEWFRITDSYEGIYSKKDKKKEINRVGIIGELKKRLKEGKETNKSIARGFQAQLESIQIVDFCKAD